MCYCHDLQFAKQVPMKPGYKESKKYKIGKYETTCRTHKSNNFSRFSSHFEQKKMEKNWKKGKIKDRRFSFLFFPIIRYCKEIDKRLGFINCHQQIHFPSI